ncbi:HD domain-containing protein [candidate division KSB1 bacterium]|nr:HD domain-containing protein [candidate division KSB1 bacterium]
MNEKQKNFKSVYDLLYAKDPEPEHAEHVTRLALQLFDALAPLHQLTSEERDLLKAASLLHDIGWLKGGKKHHKTSMKMILEKPLPPWSQAEQLMIANIARYHRKALPRAGHDHYDNLDSGQQKVVQALAAILRLADGLDRSHAQIIRSINCQIDYDKVVIHLFVSGNSASEQYGFGKKRDLFQQVFALPIEIGHIEGSS